MANHSPLEKRFSDLTTSKPKFLKVAGVQTNHRINLSIILLLLGMTIVFLTSWLGNWADLRNEATGLGVYRFYFLAFSLIFFSVLIRISRNGINAIWRNHFYRVWLSLYFGLFFLMEINGILDGRGIFNLAWDSIFYLLVIIIFLGQDNYLWFWLNRLLIFFTLIGIFFGMLSLINFSLPLGYSIIDRSLFGGTNLSLSSTLLFASPFLLYTYSIQSRLGRIVAFLGCILLLVFGIIAQTRSSVFQAIIPFLLAGFIWKRTEIKLVFFKRVIFIGFLFITLILIVWNSSWAYNIGLNNSWQELLRRSFGSTTIDKEALLETTLADYRLEEAKFFIEGLTWGEWIIGRGVSARWSSPYAYSGIPRSMVHIGYLNLIFKGGVILLLLFLIFPVGVGWIKFFKSHDPRTMACGAIMISYTISLFYGGFLEANQMVVLFYLCAGWLAGNNNKNLKIKI